MFSFVAIVVLIYACRSDIPNTQLQLVQLIEPRIRCLSFPPGLWWLSSALFSSPQCITYSKNVSKKFLPAVQGVHRSDSLSNVPPCRLGPMNPVSMCQTLVLLRKTDPLYFRWCLHTGAQVWVLCPSGGLGVPAFSTARMAFGKPLPSAIYDPPELVSYLILFSNVEDMCTAYPTT